MNLFKNSFCYLFLLFAPLVAAEPSFEATDAHYDGERILLSGHVVLTHEMGRVTAQTAVLKQDHSGETAYDFPTVRLEGEVVFTLAQGGTIRCDHVILDRRQMCATLIGAPQVYFSDKMGNVAADRVIIMYKEQEEKLAISHLRLQRSVALRSADSPSSQYALADELDYDPETDSLELKGFQNRVLFFDTQKQIQISTKTLHAQKKEQSGRWSVQGKGDVRFVFGEEELTKIKEKFHL